MKGSSDNPPALTEDLRFGVDTLVVDGSASASDSDSTVLCLWGTRGLGTVVLVSTLSHGSVLVMPAITTRTEEVRSMTKSNVGEGG